MDPKPPPPTSLLLRNQEWVIVPALNWVLVTRRYACYFPMGDKYRCGEDSVVMKTEAGAFTHEGLCVDHMGSHLWVGDDGVLYQWRANPPYINKKQSKYERWRRYAKFE